MPACHSSERDARPFVITPYVEHESGRLMPELPDEGPCRERSSAPCRLAVDHTRCRKTGPCFPLTVLRCRAHGRYSFTLYPPGHVPYGRYAVAPIAVDGGAVQQHGPEDARVADFAEPWRSTIFVAAIDAAAGKPWPRLDAQPGPWYSTHKRHLRRLARWFGLLEDPSQRSHIAASLGVALLVITEGVRDLAGGSSYRAFGAAIVRILFAMPKMTPLTRCDHLLGAGHHAGLWAQPLRWEPRSQQLRKVPFRPDAPRGPPKT